MFRAVDSSGNEVEVSLRGNVHRKRSSESQQYKENHGVTSWLDTNDGELFETKAIAMLKESVKLYQEGRLDEAREKQFTLLSSNILLSNPAVKTSYRKDGNGRRKEPGETRSMEGNNPNSQGSQFRLSPEDNDHISEGEDEVIFTQSLQKLHFKVLVSHGHTCKSLGDKKEALKSYVHASRIKPKKHFLAFKIGNLAIELGLLRLAKQCFMNAVKYSPQEWLYLKKLAELCYETADFERCLKVCERALRYYPTMKTLLAMRERIKDIRNSSSISNLTVDLSCKSARIPNNSHRVPPQPASETVRVDNVIFQGKTFDSFIDLLLNLEESDSKRVFSRVWIDIRRENIEATKSTFLGTENDIASSKLSTQLKSPDVLSNYLNSLGLYSDKKSENNATKMEEEQKASSSKSARIMNETFTMDTFLKSIRGDMYEGRSVSELINSTIDYLSFNFEKSTVCVDKGTMRAWKVSPSRCERLIEALKNLNGRCDADLTYGSINMGIDRNKLDSILPSRLLWEAEIFLDSGSSSYSYNREKLKRAHARLRRVENLLRSCKLRYYNLISSNKGEFSMRFRTMVVRWAWARGHLYNFEKMEARFVQQTLSVCEKAFACLQVGRHLEGNPDVMTDIAITLPHVRQKNLRHITMKNLQRDLSTTKLRVRTENAKELLREGRQREEVVQNLSSIASDSEMISLFCNNAPLPYLKALTLLLRACTIERRHHRIRAKCTVCAVRAAGKLIEVFMENSQGSAGGREFFFPSAHCDRDKVSTDRKGANENKVEKQKSPFNVPESDDWLGSIERLMKNTGDVVEGLYRGFNFSIFREEFIECHSDITSSLELFLSFILYSKRNGLFTQSIPGMTLPEPALILAVASVRTLSKLSVLLKESQRDNSFDGRSFQTTWALLATIDKSIIRNECTREIWVEQCERCFFLLDRHAYEDIEAKRRLQRAAMRSLEGLHGVVMLKANEEKKSKEHENPEEAEFSDIDDKNMVKRLLTCIQWIIRTPGLTGWPTKGSREIFALTDALELLYNAVLIDKDDLKAVRESLFKFLHTNNGDEGKAIAKNLEIRAPLSTMARLNQHFQWTKSKEKNAFDSFWIFNTFDLGELAKSQLKLIRDNLYRQVSEKRISDGEALLEQYVNTSLMDLNIFPKRTLTWANLGIVFALHFLTSLSGIRKHPSLALKGWSNRENVRLNVTVRTLLKNWVKAERCLLASMTFTDTMEREFRYNCVRFLAVVRYRLSSIDCSIIDKHSKDPGLSKNFRIPTMEEVGKLASTLVNLEYPQCWLSLLVKAKTSLKLSKQSNNCVPGYGKVLKEFSQAYQGAIKNDEDGESQAICLYHLQLARLWALSTQAEDSIKEAFSFSLSSLHNDESERNIEASPSSTLDSSPPLPSPLSDAGEKEKVSYLIGTRKILAKQISESLDKMDEAWFCSALKRYGHSSNRVRSLVNRNKATLPATEKISEEISHSNQDAKRETKSTLDIEIQKNVILSKSASKPRLSSSSTTSLPPQPSVSLVPLDGSASSLPSKSSTSSVSPKISLNLPAAERATTSFLPSASSLQSNPYPRLSSTQPVLKSNIVSSNMKAAASAPLIDGNLQVPLSHPNPSPNLSSTQTALKSNVVSSSNIQATANEPLIDADMERKLQMPLSRQNPYEPLIDADMERKLQMPLSRPYSHSHLSSTQTTLKSIVVSSSNMKAATSAPLVDANTERKLQVPSSRPIIPMAIPILSNYPFPRESKRETGMDPEEKAETQSSAVPMAEPLQYGVNIQMQIQSLLCRKRDHGMIQGDSHSDNLIKKRKRAIPLGIANLKEGKSDRQIGFAQAPTNSKRKFCPLKDIFVGSHQDFKIEIKKTPKNIEILRDIIRSLIRCIELSPESTSMSSVTLLAMLCIDGPLEVQRTCLELLDTWKKKQVTLSSNLGWKYETLYFKAYEVAGSETIWPLLSFPDPAASRKETYYQILRDMPWKLHEIQIRRLCAYSSLTVLTHDYERFDLLYNLLPRQKYLTSEELVYIKIYGHYLHMFMLQDFSASGKHRLAEPHFERLCYRLCQIVLQLDDSCVRDAIALIISAYRLSRFRRERIQGVPSESRGVQIQVANKDGKQVVNDPLSATSSMSQIGLIVSDSPELRKQVFAWLNDQKWARKFSWRMRRLLLDPLSSYRIRG
mmetsp:Transcript_7230/g.11013  ORF Transcript_7230/g.11013 Transcript_7230/m.11013 type:complete len:2155 (+) Transcript_7230:69-6533(+)